jgi:hypothetical protein
MFTSYELEPNVVPLTKEETVDLSGWLSAFISLPTPPKGEEDDSLMEVFLSLSAEQQDMVLTR